MTFNTNERPVPRDPYLCLVAWMFSLLRLLTGAGQPKPTLNPKPRSCIACPVDVVATSRQQGDDEGEEAEKGILPIVVCGVDDRAAGACGRRVGKH